jgi:solute carrier family 25 folate transporter 32
MIKSKLTLYPQNFTPTTATPKLSMLSVIASTYRNEGLLAFYKGLGTNALRILPGTCTTFVVYENLVWGFRSLALRRQARERAESNDALR